MGLVLEGPENEKAQDSSESYDGKGVSPPRDKFDFFPNVDSLSQHVRDSLSAVGEHL
jgi:hypothetical protein